MHCIRYQDEVQQQLIVCSESYVFSPVALHSNIGPW